jgi:hypothetical protein
MKIATFNINNIKSRLPNLLDWLTASKPDAVSASARGRSTLALLAAA